MRHVPLVELVEGDPPLAAADGRVRLDGDRHQAQFDKGFPGGVVHDRRSGKKWQVTRPLLVLLAWHVPLGGQSR